MTTLDAMKQALEYLRDNQHHIADNERHVYVMEYNAFIDKLAAAIEEMERAESFKIISRLGDICSFKGGASVKKGDLVYTTPAAAQPALNLNCKSVQKRLMTQWGYEFKPAAHGIKGEA